MKNIVIILLVALVIAAGYFLISRVEIVKDEPVGSVSQASEYHATSTFTGIDGHQGACRSDSDVLLRSAWYSDDSKWTSTSTVKNPTILGSVVVASTTPHIMRIKNATTTTGTYANSSSTVVTLPQNLGVGTYTFDIALERGIVIDFEKGFCGDYIVTFR